MIYFQNGIFLFSSLDETNIFLFGNDDLFSLVLHKGLLMETMQECGSALSVELERLFTSDTGYSTARLFCVV